MVNRFFCSQRPVHIYSSYSFFYGETRAGNIHPPARAVGGTWRVCVLEQKAYGFQAFLRFGGLKGAMPSIGVARMGLWGTACATTVAKNGPGGGLVRQGSLGEARGELRATGVVRNGPGGPFAAQGSLGRGAAPEEDRMRKRRTIRIHQFRYTCPIKGRLETGSKGIPPDRIQTRFERVVNRFFSRIPEKFSNQRWGLARTYPRP